MAFSPAIRNHAIASPDYHYDISSAGSMVSRQNAVIKVQTQLYNCEERARITDIGSLPQSK